MEIFKHPVCTTSIGAPSDMQDGSCSALPVLVTKDEYGMWCNSFWKPDADELVALINGGSVRLQVRCSTHNHPVIGMGVTFKTEAENEPT